MFGFKSLAKVGRKDTPLSDDSVDALEIAPYARGLEHFICSCDTPMTVGIQGEWGSGKTSMMRLIQQRLSPTEVADRPQKTVSAHQSSVMTFWFETWQYGAVGHSDQLGLLLMRDLAGQLLSRLKADDRSYRYVQNMKSFLQQAAPAVAAGAVSTATGGVIDGGTLVGALSTEGSSVSADMRQNFGELVDHALTKSGKQRLIVFIDDLDRIPPARAVRLLEVLKNFMDVPRCIFVVACDYDVVREGVSELMGLDAARGDHKSREKIDAFFHKIFQVPFHMPTASYSINALFKQYVERKLLTENEGLGSGKTIRGRTPDQQLVDQFLSRATSGSDNVNWFRSLSETVEGALGTNPRAFKRYLNVVDLTCCVDAAFAHMGTPRSAKSDKSALAQWSLKDPTAMQKTKRWLLTLFPLVALQQRWPDFAPHLLSDVQSEFKLELGGTESVQMTVFERRLRTLAQWWPDHVSSEEYANDLEDETLIEVLLQIYGDAGGEREHPEIQRLERFCRSWYELLNNTHVDNRLTNDELEPLQKWSERLGRMGASRSEPRGVAAFQQACLRQHPKAGDGFAALSSLIVHTIKSRELTHLFAESKKPEEFRVFARTGSQGYTKLLVLLARSGSLELKINATEEVARKKGVAGLDETANVLMQAWREEAGLQDAHVAVKPQSIWVRYDQWHHRAGARALREPMITFLNEVDDLFRASGMAPVSPASASHPAPSAERGNALPAPAGTSIPGVPDDS